MASTARTPRWLARARRAGVLAAAAASVAGCMGMPNSGPPGTVGANPQDTTPDSDFIVAVPAGPGARWTPTEIVNGFLNASVSYPNYQQVADEYLTSSGVKAWNPGSSVEVVDQINPPSADVSQDGRHAVVTVSGPVRASFDGTGQYVGAQESRGNQQANQQFNLVKVNGEWRITNPLPHFRILTEPDFAQAYKPQDLYFFDAHSQVLVPDSVFVPAGTSPSNLVKLLVEALAAAPQAPWLRNGDSPPAVTAFPVNTKIISVTVDGTTATVNLGGAAAKAGNTLLGQISAQLVWTLTGPQQGSLPPIQAVQLIVKGQPWIPPRAPCAGVGNPNQSPAQKWAMYACYNPYPAATSSAFYYTDNGQAWSRCAPESQVTAGTLGPVVPLFTRASAARPQSSCANGASVQASSPAVPSGQAHGVPPLSRVAVSPDNKYTAGVSPGGNLVEVWASGAAKPSYSLPASGVTTIGWDRADYLWVTQGENTTVVIPTGSGFTHKNIPNRFGGKIISLGIAPDGVRVAAIVTAGSGNQLELAAIAPVAQAVGQLGRPVDGYTIGQTVQLGPNISDPIALTWYDADDLLVLNHSGGTTTLWEVPVDGQPATRLPGSLPGAISITANSTQNAMVIGLAGAGLAGGGLEVSASLEGPWQPLGSGGQNPAFPSAVPAAVQS